MDYDQRDVIDFLSRPSSYGVAVERVDIIETHVSLVFLAGDRVYKLKRAVKFPYLDFSSAEQRRIACEAELALNRRTAPELYLEVRALTRGSEGEIGFTSAGPVIDWIVVMRRFERGGAAALGAVIEINHHCLMAARGSSFAAGRIAEVRRASLARLAAVG